MQFKIYGKSLRSSLKEKKWLNTNVLIAQKLLRVNMLKRKLDVLIVAVKFYTRKEQFQQ